MRTLFAHHGCAGAIWRQSRFETAIRNISFIQERLVIASRVEYRDAHRWDREGSSCVRRGLWLIPASPWKSRRRVGISIFRLAARNTVQEIFQVHREGKDDRRAAFTGDHVEGREIAKLHRFGLLTQDFG